MAAYNTLEYTLSTTMHSKIYYNIVYYEALGRYSDLLVVFFQGSTVSRGIASVKGLVFRMAF